MACLIWQSLITTFGLILAATGAILGFYVFPNIVTKKIADSFQLTNGSDAFERWMNTPTPVYMKIYFFNISNPQDVKNGGAPIVKEIGPYVYDLIKSKVDIAEENDNLTYYQRQLFHFNQDSSGCHKEDDVIVVANLPLMKNKTEEKSYKINSGVKNIKLLGEIIEWNNSTKISAWNDNGTCNNVYGSDSMLFPPYVTENTNITVFQSDICRTVYLDFENRSKYKGLSSIKFVESNMLTSGATFSNNKCFCVNETKGILGEDGCLLDGAMELQTCLNTPVVLTFPHFFKAHTKYQNGVLGVNPNKTLHETFVELEPKTGVVLRGAKRVQFNIFYRKIKHAKLTDKLNETLMPVLWIDEGIELEDKYVDRLNEQLFSILMMLDKIEWALIGVGLLVSIIGFMTFFIVVKINLRKSGG
ncbi:sensory neuron membrane protein 2 [Copidosoma floridanum]|uniref:sensory neuron membrane protein 2 n=1 Tax=Copidosoma floridanum TaxID=29053 RepID=UPI000C6FA7FF|nr:sensory neuron membrane protein 2 [Copidosoma floridanum]